MSIGDTLAEARRQAGLTVAQVSQQTRIRESIVRAIEQGDFSPCGGDFYARGHIRSIAEVVGVDPVPLVREYDEEHGPPGKMRASQIFEPSTPIKIRDPRNLHLGRVLAVALLAVIGFGAYRLVSTRDPHPSATAAATVRPAVTAKPKVTAPPAAPKVTIPKNEAVIQLTAKSDCWVGLNSPTGQSLFQGIVPAGQTRTWDEKNPVSMVIGNPPGAQLTVNGKPEQMNTVQVVTLSINPLSKTPVTVG
ncbi:MAG: helix-turn-helix domain-containing protein [Trebonia sp.]